MVADGTYLGPRSLYVQGWESRISGVGRYRIPDGWLVVLLTATWVRRETQGLVKGPVKILFFKL